MATLRPFKLMMLLRKDYPDLRSLGGFYFQGGKVVSLPVLATSSYYGYTLVL